ncbi:MAG: hypothetical protein ACYDGS_05135 [Thermoleophilia bacterium]
MIRKQKIIICLGFLGALLLAALMLAGCGDDSKSTTRTAAVQCSPDTPSIIPPPSGKPQYVLFYRDT